MADIPKGQTKRRPKKRANDFTSDARTQEMLRRVVRGQTANEIANAIGMTPKTVTQVKNTPRFREKLSAYRDELVKQNEKREAKGLMLVTQATQLSALEALDALLEVMRSTESEELKTRVATQFWEKGLEIEGLLGRPEVEAVSQNAIIADQFIFNAIAGGLADVKEMEDRVTKREGFEPTKTSPESRPEFDARTDSELPHAPEEESRSLLSRSSEPTPVPLTASPDASQEGNMPTGASSSPSADLASSSEQGDVALSPPSSEEQSAS